MITSSSRHGKNRENPDKYAVFEKSSEFAVFEKSSGFAGF